MKCLGKLGGLIGPLVLILLTAGGCGSGANRAGDGTEDRVPPEPGATVQVLRASPGRLPTDYRRAAADLGWGVLNASNGPDAAQLLLPDDRQLHVTARRLDDRSVEVTATVQPFADAKAQQTYLNQLARTLGRPPARQYGGRFELPPLGETPPVPIDEH